MNIMGKAKDITSKAVEQGKQIAENRQVANQVKQENEAAKEFTTMVGEIIEYNTYPIERSY